MKVYTIGHVAKITGLTEFTLRAWERRYGVPLPSRSPSGRRVYASREIEKLQLLKRLTENGHAISEIARLDMSKLNTLTRERTKSAEISQKARRLLSAVQDCDLTTLSALLKSAQLENDTRTFLLEIVSPTLSEIGDRVLAGTMDVYHEHAASSVIRNILSGILYSIERIPEQEESQEVVFATPEGEFHEFGILISAILTALQGHRVLYLGTNMPAISLARALKKCSSPVAVIGCSTSHKSLTASEYREYVNTLSAEAPPSISFWFGGTRNDDICSLSALKKRETLYMNRYQDLEKALKAKDRL